MILYTYQFELKLTIEQAERLSQMAGCVRKVWNYFLGLQKKKFAEEQRWNQENNNVSVAYPIYVKGKPRKVGKTDETVLPCFNSIALFPIHVKPP